MACVSPVRSPCVGVCALDERDICIACRRTGQEISQRGRYSNEQRLHVLEAIEQRYRAERDKN
ncbi:MAG: DUF1289 domain-containing protein [Pseudomonadales bacterium]